MRSDPMNGKGLDSPLASLNHAALQYTHTAAPRPVPSLVDPIRNTGSYCTDHMITVMWNSATGWETSKLVLYDGLRISPTASVLHYATSCFEGMKAYRGYDGALRLFRPDCNTHRMLMSAERIALPTFDPDGLKQLIFKLLEVDGHKFLPASGPGKSIYLRPTIIGTHCGLGVAVPQEAMLFIIATYMPELSDPEGGMRLFASQKSEVRAWPGGHGFAKVGANYGPTLQALEAAKTRGYDQVLWLFGPEHQVTECGGSNFFIVWKSKDGTLKLQTAALDDKLILDGVVRRSILQLADERLCGHADETLRAKVVVESFTMPEVLEAVREGRVVEAFTCGTAFFVCPISTINYEGEDLAIPMECGNAGRFTTTFRGWLGDIFYGKEPHSWAPIVNESE